MGKSGNLPCEVYTHTLLVKPLAVVGQNKEEKHQAGIIVVALPL